MRPRNLLETARKLTKAGRGKPLQSDLKRALSTAYYAAFHCLARTCADCLIGTNSKSRSKHAWRQVYRALEHGPSKTACADGAILKRFPPQIQDFANTFKEMQEKRHEADYDPYTKLMRSQVNTDIDRVEAAIEGFLKSSPKDRTAFCTFVLFRKR